MLITGLEATENHLKVLAFYKAVEPQFIEQCKYGRRLARGGDQDPQAIGTARLLRPRCERPSRSCAADQRDELAARSHSITSSASASSLSGICRPSAFAVLRLMTNSSFVACMTGRLAGFSPLSMRPV